MKARGKPPSATPARIAALKALDFMERRQAYASHAIERCIDSSVMTPEDRHFAATLVLGVVRTEGVLDEVLDGYLARPRRIKPNVRHVLRMGAFELLFLGKAPQHAVDQAVKLAALEAPYAKGLVNAVLRQVASGVAAFPSSDPDVPEAFFRAHGFPSWLGALLLEERGEPCAFGLTTQADEAPPVYMHVSALAGHSQPTLEELHAASVAFQEIPEIPGCIKLGRAADVATEAVRALIEEGRLLVSDAAAQLVAFLCVRDRLPSSFLEVGAGRGTKTVLIQSMAQQLWGRQIPVYACVDDIPSKRDQLTQRVAQYGAQVSEAVTADGRHLNDVFPKTRFDMVFLDAPCSGIGTLRRHPEIRWRLTPEDITSLACLQAELLASASGRVAEGATLAYSTCSIAALENEGVVDGFLASKAGRDFEVSGGLQTLAVPGGPDSHFACIMKRSGSSR